MPNDVEKVALRLLRAFQQEYESKGSFSECRPTGEIGGDVCRSQQEFVQAMNFLRQRELIWIIRSEQGEHGRASDEGLEWLDENKERWTLDRRLKLLGLILVAVGVIATVISQIWK